ncbi:MAG: hypothetical protein ACI80H_000502 [Pseudoalteromonas distincta]|jgi:hypothetical protein
MKYWSCIALLILLISCEKEIDLDDADFTKKLVLNTFLEADSSFIILLSTSVNTLSDPLERTLNGEAHVVLKIDETPIYNNKTDVINGTITLPLHCLKGEKYTLELSYDDYAIVRATDEVPILSPDIAIDTFIDNGEILKIIFTLKDPTESNKYFLQLKSKGKEVNGPFQVEATKALDFSSTDKLFFSNILTYNNSSSYALFSDELLNGTTRQFEIQIAKSSLYTSGYIPEDILLQVNSVSETMYSYYINLLENTHIYGGPLSSVSRQNGNVEQGLGVFCFYTAARDSVTIP